MLASNVIMAICAVASLVVVLATIGVKLVSKMSDLIRSVEKLNENMEKVVTRIGDHEHRISMLEGVQKNIP